MQVRFAIDRPALEFGLTASRQVSFFHTLSHSASLRASRSPYFEGFVQPFTCLMSDRAITLQQSFPGTRPQRANLEPTAFAMMMSRPPNPSTASCTILSQSASFATSYESCQTLIGWTRAKGIVGHHTPWIRIVLTLYSLSIFSES